MLLSKQMCVGVRRSMARTCGLKARRGAAIAMIVRRPAFAGDMLCAILFSGGAGGGHACPPRGAARSGAPLMRDPGYVLSNRGPRAAPQHCALQRARDTRALRFASPQRAEDARERAFGAALRPGHEAAIDPSGEICEKLTVPKVAPRLRAGRLRFGGAVKCEPHLSRTRC